MKPLRIRAYARSAKFRDPLGVSTCTTLSATFGSISKEGFQLNVTGHRTKSERLLASFNRLDRETDSEAIFEYAIILGVHWLNEALHNRSITSESQDLLHSDMPPLEFEVPADLAPAFAAMKQIEVERNRYVRGPEPCPRAAAEWCDDQLRFIRTLALGA